LEICRDASWLLTEAIGNLIHVGSSLLETNCCCDPVGMHDESIDMDSKLMGRIGIGAVAGVGHDLTDRSVFYKGRYLCMYVCMYVCK
jgi:hypothetical protein